VDPEGIRQFGLVAEEAEKINPGLVARDADGKPYTVRDEAVNAMLLNKFLKEHRKVEEQAATIAELKVGSRLCFVPGFIQTQACPSKNSKEKWIMSGRISIDSESRH
jgi:hypothetical protein